MTRIETSVDKVVDRGPKYGFIEVQVSFEEKAQPDRGIGLAYVVVPLRKADVGTKTYEEIRTMAVAMARSFLERCVKTSGTSE